MFQKLNFQYLLSYFGLFPFVFIILDKYFLFLIKKEIYLNFSLYYTIIIFVFIGSINWNLQSKIKNHLIIYGFVPSLFATIIILLNLYNFNILNLILLLTISLLLQLLLDYILIYNSNIKRKPFFLLRLPLTLIIVLCIYIIKL